MPSGRWGFATAAFRDRIYVFGGKDSGGIVSSTLAYDPVEDRWSSVTPKPIEAYNLDAAVVGGKIYAPGGWTVTGTFTSTLEVYDPVADVWTRGEPMPSPLAAYGLVSLEGRLFVIGGWDGQSYRSSVYEYDPSRDRWQVQTDMPTPRAHVNAEAVDGRIYVIGGANSEGDLDICEIYDPTRETKGRSPWSSGVPLPEPRSRAASAVVGRNIYITGGRGRGTASPYFRYDVGENRWLSFDIPFAGEWFGLGLEALDIQLYALGGWPEKNSQALWEYQALYRVFIP
jgi:N-acetylneuraminic acid mutarotase